MSKVDHTLELKEGPPHVLRDRTELKGVYYVEL